MKDFIKSRKTIWGKGGGSFYVEVTRTKDFFSSSIFGEDTGKNLWCVYCGIEENHSLFSEIIEGGHYNSLNDLLHGGCTFYELHTSNREKIKKIGCDYSHSYDSDYMMMETKKDARSIFHDAERLFKFLEETK